MIRTIKEATVKRYHYASHNELRQHLQLFVEPTTMDAGSRPCVASPPTSSSAKYGRMSPNASGSIRYTTC